MEALVAGVENGADAVYLGGRDFSARQYAGNFSDEELKDAVRYCHLKGVKVYVTLNILVKDEEIINIPKTVAFLYNIGVDALIVQDMGVVKLVKSIIPNFEIHGSTQMTTHNTEAVNLLYELGIKRVVLSRELSIREIKEISNNTKAEIEVFCHGALCICYSGQCLMSSIIGGRSGNRGRCAQPCRMKYNLNAEDEKLVSGFVLSPKDLWTLDNIPDLLNSGVKSLKIEGRMKKSEYVAEVVSVYRRAIDSFIETGEVKLHENDKKDLTKVFNRGGFTTGHLLGKGRSEMISIDSPKNIGYYLGKIQNVDIKNKRLKIKLEDDLSIGDGIEVWTGKDKNTGYIIEDIYIKNKRVDKAYKGNIVDIYYKDGKAQDKVYKNFDIELNTRLQNTYKSLESKKTIAVNFSIALKRGINASLKASDGDGNEVFIEGPVLEDAIKVSITGTKLKEHLSKLGGTPFYLNSIDMEIDDGLSMPISVINSMRREAVDKLISKRIDKFEVPSISVAEVEQNSRKVLNKEKLYNNKKVSISVNVKDSKLVAPSLDGGADIIIFGGDKLLRHDMDYKNTIDICKSRGKKIYMASPRIIRNEFPNIKSEIDEFMNLGGDGICAENLGTVKYCMDKNIPFSAGFSLNIFNIISCNAFSQMGADFISISPELSIKEIKTMAKYIEDVEAICYGRIEMMVSEHCPGSIVNDCKGGCAHKEYSITDRMGMTFPIKTDIYCRSHIYNSQILSMIEDIPDMIKSGINILRINILDEEEKDALRIVKAVKEVLEKSRQEAISEETKDTIEYIKKRGYTKGHYYRGVM